MKWESVRHERPCTAYKKSSIEKARKQELLEGLAEIREQLGGAAFDVPEIPEDRHPDECVCKGTNVYVWHEEGWQPQRRRIEEWLADFYDVDLVALEKEKRAVLAWVREQNP